MLNQFEGFEILLGEAMTRKIRQLEQRTDYLQKRLQHPGRKLQEQAQHLDHLDIRLRRAMAGTMQQQAVRMKTLGDKLVRQNPRDAIVQRQRLVANAVKHMMRAVSQQLESKQNKTAQAMHLLDTVSPLKTLGRGYSIIRDNNDAVIRSVAAVKAGDELRGQLADGEVVFAVTGTNSKTI